MKKLSLLFLSALFLTACGASAPEEAVEVSEEVTVEEESTGETLDVDLEASTIGWVGYKTVGDPHDGTISLSEGSISIEDGEIVGGSFVIDMDTIESNEGLDGLVDHLKNEDFFEVETYSTAEFEITSVEALEGEEGTHTISGNLTMKGETNNISFPATISEEGGVWSAQAEFVVDRTDWNVQYGSDKFFDNLGDNVIRDDMSITLDLVTL